MMIETASSSPAQVVLAEHRNIKIPELGFGLASVEFGQSAFTEADGRKAGRTTQAFLGAAVDRVDVPFIHPDIVTAQAGNRIHDEERAVSPHQPAQPFQALQRAGTGFGVDDADQFGFGMLLQGGGDLPKLKNVAPGYFEGM